jgi:thymidylate synthase
MNNIDRQYKELLEHIIHFGVEKKDRTGTGTKSIFGWQIRHRMEEGFPLLTTKKMYFKGIVTELLWFLRGDTNIKYLVDNGCHIWDGDCYKAYRKRMSLSVNNGYDIDRNSLKYNENGFSPFTQEEFINKIKTDNEFAEEWGELGPIYGKQWRSWKGKVTGIVDDNFIYHGTQVEEIDQIANLISELKTNPDSRRLMVNALNVGELDRMVLPPCHYGFQVYTRELSFDERVRLKLKSEDLLKERVTHETLDKLNIPRRAISLMWSQRSVDTGLGLSFNIASYGLLLMMIAKQVNMIPDELIGNLGDVHLYLNHIEPIKEQLTREPFELPTVKISDRVVNDISEYTLDDIILENYRSHPSIKMELSN